MATGVLWNEPWLSDALRTRLTVATPPTDVHSWLSELRYAAEDYEDCPGPRIDVSTPSLLSYDSVSCDHFNLNKYFTADEDSFSDRTKDEDAFSNAFDSILSQLGNDIYELDTYQRKHSSSGELEPDIVNIFDNCIQKIKEEDSEAAKHNVPIPADRNLKKVHSYDNVSMLSDEVFIKECPTRIYENVSSCDVNRIFYKGNGVPVPPKRKNKPQIPRRDSGSKNMNSQPSKPRPVSMMEQWQLQIDLQKGNSRTQYGMNRRTNTSEDDSETESDYQNLWQCQSGAKKPILNHAQVNQIRYDNIKDLSDNGSHRCASVRHKQMQGDEGVALNNSRLRVPVDDWKHSCVTDDISKRYSYDDRLAEQRNRMVRLSDRDMLLCTSECDLLDDCHRSLAADRSDSFVYKTGKPENIYENLKPIPKARTIYTNASFVDDDGNSSVEILSDSDSWRTPMEHRRTTSTSTDYTSESPVYENLQDIRATSLIGNVLAWKSLLLDPFWNDDEEDEWVSPKQVEEYAQEQKPPFVIPRIREYKIDVRDEEPLSPSFKEAHKRFEEGFNSKPNNENLKVIKNVVKNNNANVANVDYTKNVANNSQLSPIIIRKKFSDLRNNNKSKSLHITENKDVIKHGPRHKVLPNDYELDMRILCEGILSRANVRDKGKKITKKWHDDEYAVLTQTSLAFYKDEKAYRNAKEVKVKNSTEIIPLRDATVRRCDSSLLQQTKRLNAIMIDQNATHDQYLIHHKDPMMIENWRISIINAINNLPSNYKVPDNADGFYGSPGTPSPTQKHLAKMKSTKVTDGSIEDLCDPNNKHAVAKSILKKFIPRRPSKESLIKNKIYEDEPVFGKSLEQLCTNTSLRVPEFVIRCIRAIESSEENMKSDGLYRASGNLSQVQKIRLEVNQNNYLILDKEDDVHVLTGVLKLFLRELKDPLVPFKFFHKCLNASSISSPEARVKEFKEIIDSLPECNRQTLKYILEHLLRVTHYKAHNRMQISNVAIVLGPTLLVAPPEGLQNFAIECLQQNRVIECLMEDFNKIFKDDFKKK